MTFVAGPNTAASDNAAVLSGSGTFTVDVSGTQTLNSLRFQQTGAITLGATVGGSTINLGAGGITVQRFANNTSNPTVGKVTINSNFNLTADQTWAWANSSTTSTTYAGTATGTANLTLQENLNQLSAVSGTLNNTGTITVSGGSANGSTNAIVGTIGANVTGLTINANTGNTTILGRTNGNSLAGPTLVSSGTLRLINSTTTSATGTGALTIDTANAQLSGTGRSSGLLAVTNGGRITPSGGTINQTTGVVSGNTAVGTLRLGITGGANLAMATINFDLASTAGGSSDQLITGDLTLGALTFNFAPAVAAGTLDTTAPYTLINSPDINGTLDLSSTTFTTNFGAFTGSYVAAYSSNDTGDLVVTFSTVPEPSTWVMLSLAGLGMVGFIKRKRSSLSAA